MTNQPISIKDMSPRALRLLRRGEQWLAQGEYGFAELTLREALSAATDHPEALRMLASAVHGQRRFDEAIALFQQALSAWPNDALLHNNIGCVFADAKDMASAATHFQRAASLSPELPNVWFNLARACEESGDTEGSLAALAEVLNREPSNMEALVLQADGMKTLGKIGEATERFRSVIRNDPNAVGAWVGLINLKTFKPTESDVANLARLHADAKLSTAQHLAIGFAYGIALESNERYSDAFRIFREVCAAKRAQLTWDARTASLIVEMIARAFAQTTVAEDPSLGSEVIFVTSMPRSGSTLTEQILAAHSEVEGAGEIGDLAALMQLESQRRKSDFPAWVPIATPADWERLGREYLEGTKRFRVSKPRFTDKSIINWQLLGAARAMLPGAHFIGVRRDPLETCWSCYKHDFGIRQPFTYDFDELATYLRDYERMMSMWKTKYPGQVYEQSYEQLVANPEQQIRALLEHCGLKFEPGCLRSHEAERDVRTASAGQVRSEIRSDTARVDNYGSLLDPLRQAIARTR